MYTNLSNDIRYAKHSKVWLKTLGYITFDAPHVTKLFFLEIVHLHGISRSITSHHDVKFISSFWRELWKCLRTELRLSSAYCPKTDDQTEVVNCSLGNMLWCLVQSHPKQWDNFIAQAEFSFNSMVNRSTGKTHFSVVYTKEPNAIIDV